MFEALERIPREELEKRWARVRSILVKDAPSAGGLLVFSKLNIYWLAGSMAPGVFWLPLEGEPLYLVRKGIERAELESSVGSMTTFRSYKDLPGLCVEAGSPLPEAVAAEMAGLSWQLGASLVKNLGGARFLSGDGVLAKAQAVKTDWELAKLRLAGARHHECLHDIAPLRLKPGMTEREISHVCWEIFFSRGHGGHMRMGAYGEEIFLGHVSAGDSGNYPSVFNGPLGLRGEHPALPVMGYAGKIWKMGEPLALDVGFMLEGYHTDKTQLLFAGAPEAIPAEAKTGHDFCMAVQAWTAENLKPGAVPSEIYAHVVKWAEKEGFAGGFMGLGANQVRFLGHGIGLTIDAWPVLAKGFDEPLEAGMTLAVEPKFGIRDFGMVGVENTFEVTESGGKCLTGDEYSMLCVE